VTRDAAATKAKILKAATEEFAAHGIAGARVDRIAASAACNKNMIYIYFRSKDLLFDAVFAASIAELVEAAPFDAENLPAYAGALFDFHIANPQLVRLATWHSLERPGELRTLPITVESGYRKGKAIAAAQAAGTLYAGLSPEHLLPMVLSLAQTWSEGTQIPMSAEDDPVALAACRRAVVVGVSRLINPDPTA
jgi:AcrR family transcriptional regulator